MLRVLQERFRQTGACANRIAMYDFCISSYTVVQVDEMILSLILSIFGLVASIGAAVGLSSR